MNPTLRNVKEAMRRATRASRSSSSSSSNASISSSSAEPRRVSRVCDSPSSSVSWGGLEAVLRDFLEEALSEVSGALAVLERSMSIDWTPEGGAAGGGAEAGATGSAGGGITTGAGGFG